MFDELLRANSAYASGYELAGLEARAAKGLALLTCMDTRIEPLPALGLRPGDAKILRNAGARVTADVVRSLVLATHLLGVHTIVVMQHTDCALAFSADATIRGRLLGDHAAPTPAVAEAAPLSAGSGALSSWLAANELLAMPDPDAALGADVEALRSCRALATGVTVEGWRYDVGTGRLDRVVTA